MCATASVRTMSEELKKALSYSQSASFRCRQLPNSESDNVCPSLFFCLPSFLPSSFTPSPHTSLHYCIKTKLIVDCIYVFLIRFSLVTHTHIRQSYSIPITFCHHPTFTKLSDSSLPLSFSSPFCTCGDDVLNLLYLILIINSCTLNCREVLKK